MRCLFLSQELAPYFAEGGLGLTTATLPGTLHAAFGIEFTIMLPYYPWLVEKAGLRTEMVAEFPPLAIGKRREAASVHRALGVGGPSEVLLIRSDAWYQRDGGVYRDRHYVQYEDAIARAAFFGWCVRRWLEANPGRFSVIHGNDWQSGMALFLSARARWKDGASAPGLLYQIHTAEAQGRIESEVLPTLGLDEDERAAVETIGRGQASMMLLGMCAADALVTCSPGYAHELFGMLDGTPMLEPLERMGITGIISGIDSEEWDPAHSDAPSQRYTAATVEEGKQLNKQALQALCGFRVDPDQPLFGICSRLVPEKGIDLVLNGLEILLRADHIQLLVMGLGDRQYVEAFNRLNAELRGSVCYYPAFDMRVARLLYAGCDFTLMPSLVEPCGLNQLISMRYGTPPIVNPVGGLKDTVIDMLRDPARGNGFVLARPSAGELRTTVERSIAWLQRDPSLVRRTRQHMMGLDWSWGRAAVEYAAVYEALVSPSRRRPQVVDNATHASPPRVSRCSKEGDAPKR